MIKKRLTSDQFEAIRIFESWLKNASITEKFVLSGFAGSGKTFLSTKFLTLVEENNFCWTVVAPTHKAVGVLRKVLKETCLTPTLRPSTIHRLLRLKLKWNGDLEVCEETSQTEKSLEKLGLVLIDEASMIDSRLLEIILKCSQKSNTRLIFVGDPGQLPPIGESISPVFSMKKVQAAHLNLVVRHQGPILNLASLLREESFPCTPPTCFPTVHSDNGIVGCLSNNEWLEKAQLSLLNAAQKKDPDQARILCYTNRYLERLIPYARRAIHGSKADKMSVLPGEVLITRRAVMLSASIDKIKFFEEPGILFGSNEEIIVKEVNSETFDFMDIDILCNISIQLPVIQILVAKVLCRNHDFLIRLLPEPGSESRINLDNILEELTLKAKKQTGSEARKLWKAFFYVRDLFASVGPASVLTVHRSQGSTFGEVFLASDIFWPKNINLRKQLAYVGVSRASKAVWLLDSNKKNNGINLWENRINSSS